MKLEIIKRASHFKGIYPKNELPVYENTESKHSYQVNGRKAKNYLLKTLRSLAAKNFLFAGSISDPEIMFAGFEQENNYHVLCLTDYYHPYTSSACVKVWLEKGDNFKFPNALTEF